VSTGAVALGAIVGVESVGGGTGVPPVPAAVVVARVPVEAVAPEEAGAAGFLSLPEETTIAATTPATAATATAAASRAFFTDSEATLARPCQNGSKSS
jgi:hypothetical protein